LLVVHRGGVSISDEPLTEDSPLGPTNVYGHTKLVVEQTLEWYRQIHGLHYAALRYFNACGAVPGRGEAHNPESHLIPRVLQVALGQVEAATIFGTDYPTPDGTCIRDYVHLADLFQHTCWRWTRCVERPDTAWAADKFSVRQVVGMRDRSGRHPGDRRSRAARRCRDW
jgi:UDP-glucose 4-epimerase